MEGKVFEVSGTWLPGVTFRKALATAMPGDEHGLEGWKLNSPVLEGGREEQITKCLLTLPLLPQDMVTLNDMGKRDEVEGSEELQKVEEQKGF